MNPESEPDAVPGGREPAAPAVIFLPGFGQMPTDWQDQVTALPTGWRGYVPWLAGMKPTDTSGFELDRAVGGVVTMMETQGIRRAHVCGLSIGSVVALRLAAEHPALVDRLVLASGQVTPRRSVMKLQLAVMRRTPEAKFLAQGLTKEKALSAFAALAALDLRGDLAKVRAPTLVLTGEQDKPNRPVASALAAGIRGATVAVIAGAHALNTSAPDEFNTAVYGFLTGAAD
ncbi:MAG: alpha/beta fold hydrolase [Nocardioides sp.]